MSNPSDIVTIGLITNVIAVASATWWVAKIYGRLEAKIDANRRDINELGKTLRDRIRQENRINQLQILHLQGHLEKTSNYHAPSFPPDNFME